MNQNNFLSSFLNWLAQNQLKIELPVVLMSLVGILMMAQKGEIGGTVAGIGLTALAIFYFISAYIPSEDRTIAGVVMTKVMAISMSITVIGIMFYVLQLHGSKICWLSGSYPYW